MDNKIIVPSAYEQGYAKARRRNPKLADTYIRHTTVGDTALDPVMRELSSMPQAQMQKYIRAGIERDQAVFSGAPQALKDFFAGVDDPPPWVDFESFAPAGRAFFKNMSNMLIAYAIGSAVEGFSTLVSKSFAITGRVTKLDGGATRRLRQNNRHMLEVYYPNGMTRDSDGWKVTMRIRFVHARVRQMLAECEDWNHDAWGTPLSMAHLGGISLYTFSIRQFEHAMSLGAKMTREERESIVRVWRYVGHLFGVPKEMLFTNTEEARAINRISYTCEPPPDNNCRDVANTVFKALPAMAGLKDQREIVKMQAFAYRLSRALIGNRLANTLDYPKSMPIRWVVLFSYKQTEKLKRLLLGSKISREEAFFQIFSTTQFDGAGGISYSMPDHVYASQSSPW